MKHFHQWNHWQGICLLIWVQLVSHHGETSASTTLFVTEPWLANTCRSFGLSNQTGCSASATFWFLSKCLYIPTDFKSKGDKALKAVCTIVGEIGGPVLHTNANTVFNLTSLCSSFSIRHSAVTFLLSYHISNEGQVWAAHAQAPAW